MVLSLKHNFDFNENLRKEEGNLQRYVIIKGKFGTALQTTRTKAFGSILIWLYAAVIFILMCSVGYFALRTSEFIPGIFPCSYNSDDSSSYRNTWHKSRYCPPVVNIFFLKTHKCASSTVQNILMRYGDERNLSFILPKELNYIGHPERFSRLLIKEQLATSPHYNILCHHLRFNAKTIQEVMPRSAIYMSILRNPVSLFKSMYDYYNMSAIFNHTIEDFIEDDKSKDALNSKRIYSKLGRNQMLFDFGYDSDIWNNKSLIEKAIKEIDKTFDLIMILELFDESLILLKHMLCWSMSDIIYLKHNMRPQFSNVDKNDSLSLKVEKYNNADKMLYDYFYRKMNNSIDSFGRERMKREVENLKLWNNLWFNHCVRKMVNMNETVPKETKAYNSKVYSFVLNSEPISEICRHLAMEELQYTDKLRAKQKLFYRNK